MSTLRAMMESRIADLNEMLAKQGERFHLEQTSVFKNNGIRDGFILKDPEQAVSPTVYLNEEQLQKSDAELVQFLVNVHAHSDRPDLVAVQNFMEKYCILDHVLPRLYDASNEAMMKERGIAFTKLPDLGLLVGYYLVISKSGDGTASVTLKQSHLSYVGLDVSDLYDEAVKNLASIATIENMNSLLGRISGIRMDDELPMWVISNENHLQGAAAILCQSVIEKIKQRIGLRFYILPSSVCEVIAVP